MTTLPNNSDQEVYRGDSGQSISFEHSFTPADVTEALLYIRDKIDGTLYFRLKFSDDPGQWTISADGTGSATFLATDLEAIADGNYRYDIKLETASAETTVQRGVINIVGSVSTDVATDNPPALEYHVSADQKSALDAANSPSGTNPVATIADIGAGVQGDTGVDGDTGVQGDTGVDGDTGVQGDTGVDGSGLLPGGRLTLTTGVPVTTSNVTAATTIYYTPYVGNQININGTTLTFTEKSVSVPATTTTPFDIFAYDNSGTLALETLNWTNDTTRATAIAIAGDGRYYKSGDTSQLYLGTGRTTGTSGQTQDMSSSRFLYNWYNKVMRPINVTYESTHTYTTGSYRAWNANTTIGQARTEFIIGLPTMVDLIMSAAWEAIDTNDVGPRMALGLDSVSAASFGSLYIDGLTASGADLYGYSIPYKWYPSIGYHYINATEYGYATSGNALYIGQIYSWMG